MTIPSRGRDDVIFGAKEKKVEPKLSQELQSAIDQLGNGGTLEGYKAVGNRCFTAGNFSAAIRMYTKALEQDSSNEVLLSNRSASYVQSPLLAGPSLALKDAEKVVALKPAWFKGHLRKADALFAAKKYRQAIEAYDKAIELEPGCTTAHDSRKHCQRELLEAGEAVSPSRAPAEACPYNAETHRAERRFVTEEERMEAEKHLDTDVLVKTWSQDTAVENGITACKKRNVNISEADREAGKSYKEQLMNSFRKKVTTDTNFSESLSKRKEVECCQGAGLDFRREAESAKKVLMKGTDGVGLAISAEAYQAQQYKSKVW